jgi:catechol 2,3-dioxygenase-like lactoylglutathione lyase family enzyme
MEEGCAIAGIDHVVVGVGDLEAARRAWIDLGFTVTPRGRHSDWGTANYCVMFAEDYVELLGIADPSRPSNNLRVFLESREGLFGLAFASDDAAAVAQALREGGIAGAGVEELSRSLELPTGEVAPSFRLVHLPPATTPGLSAFVCQHMTPELDWQEPWLAHPNGARAVLSVTAVVEDPSAVAIPYGELFGFDRVMVGDGYVQVDSGRGALRFTTADGLRRLSPGLEQVPDHPAPWLAALRLSVADPDATADYLDGRGVTFRRDADGSLRVAPARTCGVILEFAKGLSRQWLWPTQTAAP